MKLESKIKQNKNSKTFDFFYHIKGMCRLIKSLSQHSFKFITQ